MKTYDFAVIGGGIAGVSAACELAGHGTVGLIEQETRPGYHSTGRSAATLIEGYGSDAWRLLTSASRKFMENPPDGFATQPLLTPRGELVIAPESDTDTLRANYEKTAATGVHLEWHDEQRILEMCPALRPGMWGAGYSEPGAADVDVDALLQGYIRGIRANGGELFLGNGVGSVRKSGTWEIDTGSETIASPILVNAAGAWADELAHMAGLSRRGLTPKRRTAIAFPAPEEFPDSDNWYLIAEHSFEFYFRPLSAGQLMASPADETDSAPCDAQPEEIDIAIAADLIERNTRMTIPRIASSWAGLRTFAPDREPVIGADPQDNSFIWVAGQGGNGIIGSPAAAQIVAAVATRTALPISLADFDLDQINPARLEPV